MSKKDQKSQEPGEGSMFSTINTQILNLRFHICNTDTKQQSLLRDGWGWRDEVGRPEVWLAYRED